jgi:hypothetical protein
MTVYTYGFLSSGHVGCCDSSKNKHATKHFKATEHPMIKSFEPVEDWKWSYVDETFTSKGAEEAEAHLKEKPKILPLPNGPHYLLNDTQALQTMELFKDTHLIKEELLSNAIIIDSALLYHKQATTKGD